MGQNQQDAFQVRFHIMEFHVLLLQWLIVLKLEMFHNHKMPTTCAELMRLKKTEEKKNYNCSLSPLVSEYPPTNHRVECVCVLEKMARCSQLLKFLWEKVDSYHPSTKIPILKIRLNKYQKLFGCISSVDCIMIRIFLCWYGEHVILTPMLLFL